MAHPEDPAARISAWSDRIRELAALGLRYADNPYDTERYQELRELSMQMLAVATQAPLAELDPLRETHFSRPCPLITGDGAVMDDAGRLLLIRRSDNELWALPGGLLGVGESPAAGVQREVLEETGYACRAVALAGLYCASHWESRPAHDAYRLVFLCRLVDTQPVVPSHPQETLEVNWFGEGEIPSDLAEGHAKRIDDAYRLWRGEPGPHFDEAFEAGIAAETSPDSRP